jgi:16S rRNA (cytidine1402-2'-O)-methyltransferase
MSGVLYLVATPIGNLGDMTKRAADILSEVDFIAAEDTRVTLKLLNHLGIKKPVVSYYEHNRKESGEKICARLLADPGEDLVRLCAEAGIEIFAIPGACAAVAALSLSGLSTGRFTFEGYLSTSRKSRFEHLRSLKDEKRTMVFYEAPHKLMATLRDMLETFGDRRVSISREMTKIHEETLRCTLSSAIRHFEETPPRGEFVLVVEGAAEQAAPGPDMEDALKIIRDFQGGGMSLKDAVKSSALLTGFPKNVLYEAALKEKS